MTASIGVAQAAARQARTPTPWSATPTSPSTPPRTRAGPPGCCSTVAALVDRAPGPPADELREAVAAGQVLPALPGHHDGPGFGDIDGFEALARWTHPEHGPVSPAEFIPVAEDTGLIVEIGELMLRQACHQLVAWRRATGRTCTSRSTCPPPSSPGSTSDLVREALEESSLPARALWLEITESLLMADRGAASDVSISCRPRRRALHRRLRDRLLLAQLPQRLPRQIVKVDRAFVRQLASDAKSRGVTRAIIEMVNALELRGVVAEGVERPSRRPSSRRSAAAGARASCGPGRCRRTPWRPRCWALPRGGGAAAGPRLTPQPLSPPPGRPRASAPAPRAGVPAARAPPGRRAARRLREPQVRDHRVDRSAGRVHLHRRDSQQALQRARASPQLWVRACGTTSRRRRSRPRRMSSAWCVTRTPLRRQPTGSTQRAEGGDDR